MNIIKKFTFWFLLCSILICLVNFYGYDDKNLLFFILGLEPILYKAVYTEPFRSWIFLDGKILWFGYLLRIFTGIFYGIILDAVIIYFKRRKQKN